ncbi:hypothetical protein K3H46_09850 [Aeromonas veronii]|uniref:hypothetical protein n=1 Tax=Aeromonas veronii TaxID=654 RepID=UPI001F44D61E|nr:hypothetical protein [Aeromonas veronii]MCF5891320.1 hypothetical protein [Aeromonas veronii]
MDDFVKEALTNDALYDIFQAKALVIKSTISLVIYLQPEASTQWCEVILALMPILSGMVYIENLMVNE